MAGYNYTTFVDNLANEIVVPASQPQFVIQLPRIIEDAEQRIYRDLDLLATVVRDSTGVLTVNSREFTLPESLGRFVTVTAMNVFTPAGSTETRHPMVLQSLDYLNWVWPTDIADGTTVPSVYAMVTDQQVLVGAPPSAAYTMEVIGTIRPAPLSASNSETFLTQYLPDLFFAAAMVRAAGYQQNWNAAGDNPGQAVTWEGHYQTLLASANGEEMRKRWGNTTWTSPTPGPRG